MTQTSTILTDHTLSVYFRVFLQPPPCLQLFKQTFDRMKTSRNAFWVSRRGKFNTPANSTKGPEVRVALLTKPSRADKLLVAWLRKIPSWKVRWSLFKSLIPWLPRHAGKGGGGGGGGERGGGRLELIPLYSDQLFLDSNRDSSDHL